ncbi:hypothetical protein F4775DRAFT_575526, partial [Biscogniauxia sp. FL1348]
MLCETQPKIEETERGWEEKKRKKKTRFLIAFFKLVFFLVSLVTCCLRIVSLMVHSWWHILHTHTTHPLLLVSCPKVAYLLTYLTRLTLILTHSLGCSLTLMTIGTCFFFSPLFLTNTLSLRLEKKG